MVIIRREIIKVEIRIRITSIPLRGCIDGTTSKGKKSIDCDEEHDNYDNLMIFSSRLDQDGISVQPFRYLNSKVHPPHAFLGVHSLSVCCLLAVSSFVCRLVVPRQISRSTTKSRNTILRGYPWAVRAMFFLAMDT